MTEQEFETLKAENQQLKEELRKKDYLKVFDTEKRRYKGFSASVRRLLRHFSS